MGQGAGKSKQRMIDYDQLLKEVTQTSSQYERDQVFRPAPVPNAPANQPKDIKKLLKIMKGIDDMTGDDVVHSIYSTVKSKYGNQRGKSLTAYGNRPRDEVLGGRIVSGVNPTSTLSGSQHPKPSNDGFGEAVSSSKVVNLRKLKKNGQASNKSAAPVSYFDYRSTSIY